MNLNGLEEALPEEVPAIESTATTQEDTPPPSMEHPFRDDLGVELEEEYVPIKYGPQHFELMKLLGEGAFGKVYLVHSRIQKTQYYAMKVLSKRLLKKKSNIPYLKAERNVMIKLQQHPFLIHLFTAFQSRKYVYLVMNFLPGGELFLHLRKQGIIAERDVQFYLGELILGIEYIHSKGIIHRDIKPENLLLRQDGHICITDFGLAKDISDGKPARTLCGTAEYMAPEMLTRNGYGKGVDFWALGALTFEMLTSDPPFVVKSSNYKELEKRILTEKIVCPSFLSANTHALLKGMLEKDTNKRLGCSKSTMFAIGGITALKQHPFFDGLDWVALGELQLTPPISLQIQIPNDIPADTTMTTSTKGPSSAANTAADWLKLPYFHEDFTKREISFSMIEETYGPPYEPTASTIRINTMTPQATAVIGTSLPTSMTQECTPNASICTTTTNTTQEGEEIDEYYEQVDYQQADSMLTILHTTCHTMGEGYHHGGGYHTPLPSSGSGKFVFHTPRSSASSGHSATNQSHSHSFHPTPRAFPPQETDDFTYGTGIPQSLYTQYLLDFEQKQQKLQKKKALRAKQQERLEAKLIEEQAAKALAQQQAEDARARAETQRIALEQQRIAAAAQAAKAKRKAEKLAKKQAFNVTVATYQEGLVAIQKKLKAARKKLKDIVELEEKIAMHRAAGTLIIGAMATSAGSDAKKGGKEKEKEKKSAGSTTPAVTGFVLDKEQEKKVAKKGEMEKEVKDFEEEEKQWMKRCPGEMLSLQDSSDEETETNTASTATTTVEEEKKVAPTTTTTTTSTNNTTGVIASTATPTATSSDKATTWKRGETINNSNNANICTTTNGNSGAGSVWKRAVAVPSASTTTTTSATTSAVVPPSNPNPTPKAPATITTPAPVVAAKKKEEDVWETIPSKKSTKTTASVNSGKIIPGMKPPAKK